MMIASSIIAVYGYMKNSTSSVVCRFSAQGCTRVNSSVVMLVHSQAPKITVMAIKKRPMNFLQSCR
jgi:hypothetical protein